MRIAIAGATGTVGHHAVAAARDRGHETVALSRSAGVDIASGDGLAEALAGVDAVIDAANPGTTEEEPATAFFTAAAANLQRVAEQRGVGHVVTLSIVGIDEIPFGYYAAKLAQERVAGEGGVGYTLLRATQFHEFPAQLIAATRADGRASVFAAHVQTVAARTVGEVLVETAEGAPKGRAADLAGPEEAELVDLARALVDHLGLDLAIDADQTLADLPREALIARSGARFSGPTFAEWLDSEDAAGLPLR